MRLLVDTHVFLWATSSTARLSKKAKSVIEEAGNEVFISAAVAWEISIKYALGKLTLPAEPPLYVPNRVASLGFRPLPISQNHAISVFSLPMHHNDPFDRIMIAQAIADNLTLVTSDKQFQKYRVKLLMT